MNYFFTPKKGIHKKIWLIPGTSPTADKNTAYIHLSKLGLTPLEEGDIRAQSGTTPDTIKAASEMTRAAIILSRDTIQESHFIGRVLQEFQNRVIVIEFGDGPRFPNIPTVPFDEIVSADSLQLLAQELQRIDCEVMSQSLQSKRNSTLGFLSAIFSELKPLSPVILRHMLSD